MCWPISAIEIEMKYKRILLKLSGEALAGDKSFGIDNGMLDIQVSAKQHSTVTATCLIREESQNNSLSHIA